MIFNMKKLGLLGLSLAYLTLPLVQASSGPPSPLFSEAVVTIKERARETGRPYLVQFTAEWCMPCRWMESTTYKDERVKKYLEDHFLTARVDIDDFDGFAWKEYYGVKSLPTLLIFSPEGKVLEKRENSLSASQMLDLLTYHIEGIVVGSESLKISEEHELDGTESFSKAGHTEDTSSEPISRDPAPALTDHYLQFGAFGDRSNAETSYERLTKLINLPVRIESSQRADGKTLFIVRTSGTTKESEWEAWMRECRNAGVDFLLKN